MQEEIKNEPGPNEKMLELFYMPTEDTEPKIYFSNGHEYAIWKDGTITRDKEKLEIKPRDARMSYKCVYIPRAFKNPHMFLHRLVLFSYRPIEDQHKYYVNHIDGDELNNRLDNLEWITHSQNVQHGRSIYRENMDLTKPVGVICHNVFTDETKEFTFVDVCADFLGISRDTLIDRLSDKNRGRVWTDGWRVVRRQDKRGFPKLSKEDIEMLSIGYSREILLLDMQLNIVKEFKSLTLLSESIGISPGAISVKLSEVNGKKAVCLCTNRSFDLYQVKYKHVETPWLTFKTRYHAYQHAASRKAAVLITSFGKLYLFRGRSHIANFLGAAKSTVEFRLGLNNRRPAPDGLIYRWFDDWFNDPESETESLERLPDYNSSNLKVINC